jgi:peptidoglycan hydrolase-like protein with peptidoglycan-binding domain
VSRTVRPTSASPAHRSTSTLGDRRPGPAFRSLANRAGLGAVGVAGMIALLAVAAPASAAPAAGAASTTTKIAATSAPATPAGFPAGIEDLADYVPQNSCDPDPKPGVLKLGRLLTSSYASTGYVVSQPCGLDTIADEHVDGRALDWQVSARVAAQKAQADAVLNWLFATDASGRPFANARRLGVMYIIWDNKIWGSYNALAGWRPYSTCAAHPEASSDTVCHRDRVHFSLSWAGAMARTSFWSKAIAADDFGPCRPRDLNWAPSYTGRNATACPSYPVVTAPAGSSATATALVRYSGATVQLGDSGPVVSTIQQALGVVADGDFGPFTSDALVTFQRRHLIAPSGVPDAATWRALIADVVAATPVEPVPVPVKPVVNPLTRYKTTVLQYNSRGAAVMALQKRLRVTVSGWFGPLTRAAVVKYQVSVKLAATGIVNAATWKALGA